MGQAGRTKAYPNNGCALLMEFKRSIEQPLVFNESVTGITISILIALVTIHEEFWRGKKLVNGLV